MVEAAIAIGIVFNQVLTPLLGFSAAGLVVPGYLALYAGQPSRLLATFLVALATWAVVRFGLARVLVLYGRRRLGVAVLTGLLLNLLFDLAWQPMPLAGADLRVIGHIVPGLIASEALSQGVWPTLGMTVLVAAFTRIALLLIFGWSG